MQILYDKISNDVLEELTQRLEYAVAAHLDDRMEKKLYSMKTEFNIKFGDMQSKVEREKRKIQYMMQEKLVQQKNNFNE